MSKHVAFIPARKGSKGFKFKNRILFSHTANFINQIDWFDEVIVSTDDPVINELASQNGYSVHVRPESLASDDVSIKAVLQDYLSGPDNKLNAHIWLFYLTVLYRSLEDFLISKKLVEVDKARSVCSFIKAKTHPYDSWLYKKDKTLTKYIDNDVYRRQDKPDAWEHYHYVCCFESYELNSLNSELIGKSTVPMFLSDETSAKLIEVDTEQDLDDWCRQYKYTGANI
jgi:CMP-N-acetylneuraminic acid synthetase